MDLNESRSPHVTRLGRTIKRPMHYYHDHLVGADAEEVRSTNLDVLRQHALDLGFSSLFEVCLLEVEVSEDFPAFIESGGLGDLYSRYMRQRKPQSAGLEQVHQNLCAPAVDIYKREWKKLTGDSAAFKMPLHNFSPEYISEFSFETIFMQMKSKAPCLVGLVQQLCNKPRLTTSNEHQEELSTRAEKRHIAMALSVLGNHVTNRFNVIQGRLGYFLFASKVSKQVIAVLNKLGLCPSYDGLIQAIKANGEAALAELGKLCLRNEAIWISFDNLTLTADVRLQTLFNTAVFIILTAGYVVVPPESRARPMFLPSDCDYRKLKNLSLADFLPTLTAKQMMRSAVISLIWTTFKTFARSNSVEAPDLSYRMPTLFQPDHTELSKIYPLPTYDYNEGIINEMIMIHQEIAKTIGLSEEQAIRHRIMFKGDFATVHGNRWGSASGHC